MPAVGRLSLARGPRARHAPRAAQEENNAPMMAIFGGAFALMLVFLLLVNLHSNAQVRERMQQASEQGLYRIQRLDGGAGYAVIVFSDSVRVIETGASASLGVICASGSPFIDYARRIYEQEQQQIVFFLLEGSVGAMFEARECLRTLWPQRALTIGWVVADNELLKSIALEDIPPYIREYAEPKTAPQ